MNVIQRLHDMDQRPWRNEIERAMRDDGRLQRLVVPSLCTRAGADIDALAGTLQADGVAARKTQLQPVQQIADRYGASGTVPA